MKQAIDAFRGIVENNGIIALRQLAEFVLRISIEPMLPETKCVAIVSLLDTFPKDARTRAQVKVLRDQCARLMLLHPLEQRRLVARLDRWMEKTMVVNPFVSE